jgi:hypothetical protein
MERNGAVGAIDTSASGGNTHALAGTALTSALLLLHSLCRAAGHLPARDCKKGQGQGGVSRDGVPRHILRAATHSRQSVVQVIVIAVGQRGHLGAPGERPNPAQAQVHLKVNAERQNTKMAPLRAHSLPALQRNLESVAWLRVLTVVLCGILGGVLGVQGVSGVVLYLAGHFALQSLLYLRMQGEPSAYTLSASLHAWLLDGVADNVLPFLVVWSFTSALLS